MSDNNSATATLATAGELVHANPAELVIDTNVRLDVRLDKDFVASIAARGVIQPVLAVRDADGVVRVRDGQRRTLAAIQEGVATIPVFVVDAATEGDAALIERVTDQLIANNHRTALRGSEEAAAIEQLALAGMSPTKIAKTVHTSKKQVDAALATARSQAARHAVDTASLTLEQGQVLAGWDGDDAAITDLLAAAGSGTFDHVAQKLADARPAREARAAKHAELTEQGVIVLDTTPTYGDPEERLENLRHADDTDATTESVTAEHLRALLRRDDLIVDAEGTEVDESIIDWSLDGEDDPEVAPGDGMLDPRVLIEKPRYVVQWWHADPAADALHRRWERQGNSGTGASGGAVDAAAQEAASAERRAVKARNKLGASAKTVRLEKLGEYLARKTPPKNAGVGAFITATMLERADLLTKPGAKKLAAELLGGDPGELVADATDARAQVIALAVVIAAHEHVLAKDGWRADWYNHGDYLRFLAEAFAYPLAEIEQAITGDVELDAVNLD